MYTTRTGLTLGFHGTDISIVDKVINGECHLEAKNNAYDWLGFGTYFWDNSYSRALEWATALSKRKGSEIKTPAVVRAIIDLGNCLDLLDYVNISLVEEGYQILKTTKETKGEAMPVNIGGEDLLKRFLDCASIEALHQSLEDTKQGHFDSVRGVFWEGDPIYPNAGFKEKNHIQICVRNPSVIKGYFLPII